MDLRKSTAVGENLRGQAVLGMKWIGAATIFVFVINLAQNILLGRLLGPRDFGLVGMIWVILGLAQLFADSGLSNLLLQRQDLSPRQAASIVWLNFTVSIGLALLCWASAPAIAAYYREPILQELTFWAALSFAVSAAGQPFRALAQKQLRFPRLAAAELVSAVMGFVLAAWLAWQGQGVYALLFSSLAVSLIKTLFVATLPGLSQILRPVFAWRELRPLVASGGFQLGERLANYGWSNFDYLLIGRFLGSGPLGLYRMAYEMSVRPLSVVNPVFNSVATPLFARRQNDNEALRRGYLELIEMLGALVVPMMTGLCVLAPQVLLTLFGPAWTGATPALRILCLVGVLRALQNPVGNLVIAKGLFALGFRMNVVALLLTLVAYSWAIAQGGLTTLAWAAVGVLTSVMALYWKACYWDTIALSPLTWLYSLRWSAASSAIMAVALAFLPPVWHLALQVSAGALVYVAAYWLLHPAFVRRILAIVLRSRENS